LAEILVGAEGVTAHVTRQKSKQVARKEAREIGCLLNTLISVQDLTNKNCSLLPLIPPNFGAMWV
jgi:hypothetical protein